MKTILQPNVTLRHSRAAFLAALLAVSLFAVASRSGSAAAESASPVATLDVQTAEMSDDGMRLAVHFPAAEVDAAGNVAIAGLEERLLEPGAPSLPFSSTWVALPPEAEVEVEVTTEGAAARAMNAIALTPAEIDTASWAAFYGEPAAGMATPSTLPDTAGVYPAALYSVSEPQYYRDLRLVQLRLYPARYDNDGRVLLETRQFHVALRFVGANLAAGRAAPADDYAQTLATAVINFAQADNWRAFPAGMADAPTALPLSKDLFKIAVVSDGVYELTYAQLQAAGMNLAAVNPNQIEMMVRGQPVAYTFIGNDDATFSPGEKIRFVGLAFRGSRAEKAYVRENIYWLWAGGTATRIQSVANQANQGYPTVATFRSTVTVEPENFFFTTWTDQWPTFADEPDAWYWDFIEQKKTTPVVKREYQVTLPYPLAGGPPATITAELMSRESSTRPPGYTYVVRGAVKGNLPFGNATWMGLKSVRVAGSVPSAQLQPDNNVIELEFMTTGIGDTSARMYLNRISVEYQRELRASGNNLSFTEASGGQREMRIAGFTQNAPAQTLVYNLANPRLPVQIAVGANDIVAENGTYTVKVGSQHPARTEFLASTTENIRSVQSITKYRAPDLRPANGRGAWLAIAHPDQLAAANQLRTHRASMSNLSTQVVSINDVINQYGYGLPLPAAIRSFLGYAVANWTEGPRYVVFFGDATVNPRNLDCPPASVIVGGCSTWDEDEANLVLTDLPFIDRFNGLIPSDYSFSLLSGNDLLPDLAIGRIPAKTAAEATTIVTKIITYETQRKNAPQAWQRRLLFVADNADGSGNFCAENQQVAAALPGSLTRTQLCLPEDTTAAKAELRLSMSAQLVAGLSVFNYRGHGSVTNWGNGILTSTDLDFWLNDGKPVFIVSADCLDGFFAWPNQPALGEQFLKQTPNRGSVGHWSSAGLGYTVEHTVLHQGFYDGIFQAKRAAAGDAINYAKVVYLGNNGHASEAYGFILLGDPAMKVLSNETQLFLPAVRRQ